MTKKDINNFFWKVSERPDIKIKFCKNADIDYELGGRKGFTTLMALVYRRNKRSPLLIINSYCLKQPVSYIQACLFHEAGHLHDNNHITDEGLVESNPLSIKSEIEYVAQLWALWKACKLRNKKLINHILEDFYMWQSYGSKYALAYKKAVSQGLLPYKWNKKEDLIKNRRFNKVKRDRFLDNLVWDQ
jgi:hypothetical protein